MGSPHSEQQLHAALDPVLGFLNFGSGAFDPNFFRNLNTLFGMLETTKSPTDDRPAPQDNSDSEPTPHPVKSRARQKSKTPLFQASKYLSQQLRREMEFDPEVSLAGTSADRVAITMLQRLKELEQTQTTFRDAKQCKFAIRVTFENVLPKYLQFHRDLLFHQSPEFLLNSFFVGKAFELVLLEISRGQHGSDQDYEEIERDRFARNVLQQLNDFLGHRPIATLESQRIEPYPHEYFRPLPVYLRDVGVAFGKYQILLSKTLEIIRATNPDILRSAHFSPDRLDELAIDTRAFDFDHPINQRPNHHFGQWDERTIDGDGFFRRFIVHQVTLDALLARIDELDETAAQRESTEVPQDRNEAMLEAAAALSCTILMGSGISGSGPGTFDSNTSLSSLIPRIAAYRDQFYHELIRDLDRPHQKRLEKEAKFRHQPFGAVRQDLNARLAGQRATQLVNCRLAAIFARMGYPEAAEQQSSIIPVAAARIQCQIDCLLSSANDCVVTGDLEEAFSAVKTIMNRIRTGIECGAVVDPWNIIGFDGNYSLFPAIENSVRDHRVYDLLDNIERVFALLSRITSESAAIDNQPLLEQAESEFRKIVDWWKKYAAHEVSSVGAVDPDDLLEASTVVSQALNLWHRGGASAGDMEFWAPHAELLDSPKAYWLVIDALLQRHDFKTSSSLLVHWISQSEIVPLEQGDSSFHNLLFRWTVEQRSRLADATPENRKLIWKQIVKFHDYLEVNSNAYWQVPLFKFAEDTPERPSQPSPLEELDDLEVSDFSGEDSDDYLYSAAYDDITFTDSTDDGNDGGIHEGGFDLRDESLDAEAERLHDRLEFLTTLAAFWNLVAKFPLSHSGKNDELDRDQLIYRRDVTLQWIRQATKNRNELSDLLATIDAYRLKLNGYDREAMVRYDQQRLQKESLLEHTVNACLDTENALRMMTALVRAIDQLLPDEAISNDSSDEKADSEESVSLESIVNGGAPVVRIYSALLLNDVEKIVDHFGPLLNYLHTRSPLYVPLSKGGKPQAIVEARVIQTAILELLERLPASGLFEEAFALTKTTLDMERNNPVGRGAVTEFDEIFEIAYTSMVIALVRSTQDLRQKELESATKPDNEVKKDSQRTLFECIEMLTESMLPLWLEHSRTLRLSVLEKVNNSKAWSRLVEFIHDYGEGLFTQAFFHLGNVRAILHQGVDEWLRFVEKSPDVPDLKLFDELDSKLSRESAIRHMTLVPGSGSRKFQ